MKIENVVVEIGAAVGLDLPPVEVTGTDPVLPSAFACGIAAAACVGAVASAVAVLRRGPSDGVPPVPAASGTGEAGAGGAGAGPRVRVDVREAAVAFRDELYFRIDGAAGALWAPLSGDYRAADGWVRLHCNFDHHRDAVLRALGLPVGSGKEDLARACASRTALEVERAVTGEGGCAAAMRDIAGWRAHPQARAVAELPLIGLTRLGQDGGARPGGSGTGERPLAGVRVLDLTRVIAGPVAARTLAAYGAEVVRVSAAHLPEVPGLVVSTAFGKRSCELDLRTPAGAGAFTELVAGADVVVQGYRPGALAGLGFGPRRLAEIRPGIVCVDISAYGSRGPWAGRRGFDSLVQMACGIAHEGGQGERPRPLPGQILDHATGWLAAFAALAGLARVRAEGGSWHAELSLARTALWLDGLGRVDATGVGLPEVSDLLEQMDSPLGRLTYVRPPGMLDGVRPYWSSPPPRRGEHPAAWVAALLRGPVHRDVNHNTR